MSRRCDPLTRTLWHERLERFSSSGVSVARFCKQEHLSTSSFYKWRNKLEHESRDCVAVAPRRAAFRQIEVVPSQPGVSIQLPCGMRIEVRSDQLDTVRAVIWEVARVHEGHATTC